MNTVNAYLGFGLLISEIGLARWRRSAKAEGSQRLDAGSIRVLWGVILTAIFFGIWFALAGIGPRLPFPGGAGYAGVGIFLAGTALRWWAILYLGRFFTVDVAVAADHHVVDTGPYRLIRHPSYTGLLLQFAGVAAALGNELSIAVIMVPVTGALLYRIQVEEAALRKHLGTAYESYMQRTKRLIPWVV